MTKIEALEKTIYNLENNVYEYNWDSYESCNCGVLAHSIIGSNSLYDTGYRNSPSCMGFGASSEFHCLTTNLPLPEVFQAVKDAGFTFEEMLHLEVLNNVKILVHPGLDRWSLDYKNKTDVIKYLKAWVEVLKEESVVIPEVKEPTPEPKAKEIIRYVSVPESITQQSKELLLN